MVDALFIFIENPLDVCDAGDVPRGPGRLEPVPGLGRVAPRLRVNQPGVAFIEVLTGLLEFGRLRGPQPLDLAAVIEEDRGRPADSGEQDGEHDPEHDRSDSTSALVSH